MKTPVFTKHISFTKTRHNWLSAKKSEWEYCQNISALLCFCWLAVQLCTQKLNTLCTMYSRWCQLRLWSTLITVTWLLDAWSVAKGNDTVMSPLSELGWKNKSCNITMRQLSKSETYITQSVVLWWYHGLWFPKAADCTSRSAMTVIKRGP